MLYLQRNLCTLFASSGRTLTKVCVSLGMLLAPRELLGVFWGPLGGFTEIPVYIFEKKCTHKHLTYKPLCRPRGVPCVPSGDKFVSQGALGEPGNPWDPSRFYHTKVKRQSGEALRSRKSTQTQTCFPETGLPDNMCKTNVCKTFAFLGLFNTSGDDINQG